MLEIVASSSSFCYLHTILISSLSGKGVPYYGTVKALSVKIEIHGAEYAHLNDVIGHGDWMREPTLTENSR